MAKKSAVPTGFRLASGETTASGVTYPVEYLQADSLEAIRAYYESEGHNAEEVLLGIWNAANKQNATQSPKTAIRNALEEANGDAEAEGVLKAVADAQESTRTFVTGAPRQSEGFTKKAAHEMGEKVARKFVEKHGRPPTDEEVDAILDELL